MEVKMLTDLHKYKHCFAGKGCYVADKPLDCTDNDNYGGFCVDEATKKPAFLIKPSMKLGIYCAQDGCWSAVNQLCVVGKGCYNIITGKLNTGSDNTIALPTVCINGMCSAFGSTSFNLIPVECVDKACKSKRTNVPKGTKICVDGTCVSGNGFSKSEICMGEDCNEDKKTMMCGDGKCANVVGTNFTIQEHWPLCIGKTCYDENSVGLVCLKGQICSFWDGKSRTDVHVDEYTFSQRLEACNKSLVCVKDKCTCFRSRHNANPADFFFL